MKPAQRDVLAELEKFAKTALSSRSLMERITSLLHEKMTRYNWVGFYLVDPADARYLVVGPYVGSFSPNTRFAIETGLCGAAAVSGKVVVVQDVATDPRYLAGSNMVKSEIVVPIFANKKLAAELDIESYFANTFVASEQEFIEACAAVLGNYLTKGL